METGPIKIQVNDFQIMEDVFLEINEGITLISGPNSSGKSAFFRAVRSLLENPPSAKSHIRQGSGGESRVTICTDRHKVTWTRSAKSATYEVDGQFFEKIGRSVIWDHCPDFSLGRGSEGESLNFQGEWDLLFPFSRTPSQTYALFEEIFDFGDFKSALGTIRDDIRASKVEQAAAVVPMTEAREWLDLYYEIDMESASGLASSYEALCKNFDALEKGAQQVSSSEVFFRATIPESFWERIDVDQFEATLDTVDLVRRATGKLPKQFLPLKQQFESVAQVVDLYGQLQKWETEKTSLVKKRDELLEELALKFSECPLCGSVNL